MTISSNKQSNEPQEVGLIGGMEKRDIVIEEYNNIWPELFEIQKKKICRVLGDAVLRIEHIGSTAVPGLSAKPIIDILIVLEKPQNEETYLPVLTQLGYELRVREPDFDEHRMMRTPERDVHIHFYPYYSKEIDRYLIFRDQLRSNSTDRKLYEQTKRKLSEQEWDDTNDYAEAKSKIVEAIIVKGLANKNTSTNIYD